MAEVVAAGAARAAWTRAWVDSMSLWSAVRRGCGLLFTQTSCISLLAEHAGGTLTNPCSVISLAPRSTGARCGSGTDAARRCRKGTSALDERAVASSVEPRAASCSRKATCG